LDERFIDLRLVATDLFYSIPGWTIVEPGKLAIQVNEDGFTIVEPNNTHTTHFIAVKDSHVYTSRKVYKLSQLPSVFRNNVYLVTKPASVDDFVSNAKSLKLPAAKFESKKNEIIYILAAAALNMAKALSQVELDDDPLFDKIDQAVAMFAKSFVKPRNLAEKMDIIRLLGVDGLPTEIAVPGIGFNKLIDAWAEIAVYDYIVDSIYFHLNGRTDTILPYDLGGRLMQVKGDEEDDLSMA
jgi:hypothetical protein